MTIIVLIKQVPDMEKVKFDRDKGRVDRSSAGTEINPFDLNALETALQISPLKIETDHIYYHLDHYPRRHLQFAKVI